MTLPSRIYPIVDHPRWIERLGSAGARFIQLRLKDLSSEDVRAQVVKAQELATEFNVSLVLNDYWELAIELGIEWLHLGQEDLDTTDLNAIRSTGIRLGISTHSHEELDRALALRPDYVALGPIWETRLKKMAFGPQGTERITEWCELCGDIPVVAIGGITLERLPLCLQAGASSVSAVGDFILHSDPEGQVREWLKKAQK